MKMPPEEKEEQKERKAGRTMQNKESGKERKTDRDADEIFLASE